MRTLLGLEKIDCIKIGGYSFRDCPNLQQIIFEDISAWYYTYNIKTVFICEDLYHYVQNPESTLHSNTFLQKVLDYARLDEFLTETEKEKLMTSFPNEYVLLGLPYCAFK